MSGKDMLRIRALDTTRHAIIRCVQNQSMKMYPPKPHPFQELMERQLKNFNRILPELAMKGTVLEPMSFDARFPPGLYSATERHWARHGWDALSPVLPLESVVASPQSSPDPIAAQQRAETPTEPTLADVIDALNVFNHGEVIDADGARESWVAEDSIAVEALPKFIHSVGRAWYATPPERAETPQASPEPTDYVSAFMDGLSWMEANRDSRPGEWREAAIACARMRTAEAIQEPEALHPETSALVDRFAAALKVKLADAEKKYGYGDGWRQTDPDWMDDCRRQLKAHVAKGDPRDVAAYCAFLWHHGASTSAQAKGAAQPDPGNPHDK